MTVRLEPAVEGPAPEPIRDPDVIAGHLQDASEQDPGRAPCLYRPRDEEEVSAILARTRSEGVAILAVGAQSSLTGASIPDGSALISTAALDRIGPLVEWSPDRASITAGAGVLLRDLQARVSREGWFYPPVPTFDRATLGGSVATNAAGSATFKYGATRSWVRRLRVVLESGRRVDVPRGALRGAAGSSLRLEGSGGPAIEVPVPTYRLPPVKKCSMGYHAADPLDLVDLFIGAEGTLGVVTEVEVMLTRRPAGILGAWIFAADEDRAIELVDRLRRESQETWSRHDPDGLDVRAIEHLDPASLDLLRRHGVTRRLRAPIPDRARMCLLIELELGRPTSDREIEEAFEAALSGRAPGPGSAARLFEILGEEGLLDDVELTFKSDPDALVRLRELREAVPALVNEEVARHRREVDPRISKLGGDMCVPFEHFRELLDRYRTAFETRGLEHVIFGHISDGNVHPNVIAHDHAQWLAGREALAEVAGWVQSVGGSLMAEHGVGRNALKKELLARYFGPAGLDQMRRVREALAPGSRLAPGVLF